MIDNSLSTLHANRQLPWRIAAPDATAKAWDRALRPEATLLRRLLTDAPCDRRSLATSLVAQVASVDAGSARERLVDALLALLPQHIPHLSGCEIAGRYLPAERVGGDFYDLMPLPDGRIGILMGDVAGKGAPAAVVMAMARSLLRAEAATGDAPALVLQRANAAMVEVMPRGYFLTCLYLVLDARTGQLHFANAGHNQPFVRTDAGITQIDATGLPLGLFEDVEYEEVEALLPAGASVVFYSDGITEARNDNRALFGFSGMRETLAHLPSDGAPALTANGILEALAAHTGCAEQEDDIALLVLKRL